MDKKDFSVATNIILDNTEFSKINLFDNDCELSNELILNCSSMLSSFGFNEKKKGQKCICILMKRSSHYIATALAAWRMGFYIVPLNTSWPLNKNLKIINRMKPCIVVVDDGVKLDIEFNCIQKSVLFPHIANKNKLDNVIVSKKSLLPSDIAYVIFTSGSTGEPKGVVISALAFHYYIKWTRRYFSNYKKTKKLLITSELTFDITMGDIAFALAFGTDIGVAIQNFNIPSILGMVMQHKIDVLYSVPTTHIALLSFAQQKKNADLSSLKLVLSGGDSFPWKLVRDYISLTSGAHFYNVYGPTEVTINCFAIRLDDKLYLAKENKTVPIGECFNYLDHVLLDENDKPAKEGELCVTGPQLMLGYYEDTVRTKKAFFPDPRINYIKRLLYRTGDLGYYDNNLMYLKGRVDGLVKIRGYRIHPDEVSKAIDTIEGVDISAVVSFGDQRNAALAAFVKLKINSILSPEHINKVLKKLLPKYMIPTRYEFVESFPLNQSGKIDKKALKTLLL